MCPTSLSSSLVQSCPVGMPASCGFSGSATFSRTGDLCRREPSAAKPHSSHLPLPVTLFLLIAVGLQTPPCTPHFLQKDDHSSGLRSVRSHLFLVSPRDLGLPLALHIVLLLSLLLHSQQHHQKSCDFLNAVCQALF